MLFLKFQKTSKVISRRRERGDGEVVISLIVVLAMVAFAVVKCGANVSGASHQDAERSAREYAKALNIEYDGLVCAGIDSDGDGYVSCTISKKDGHLLGIECAGAMTINSGCRIPKLRAAGGQ